NPKMAVFFTSLLPQFGSSFASLLALGLVFCSLTLVWLTAYATAVAKAGDFLRRPRIRRTLDGLTGAVLVAFGVTLAREGWARDAGTRPFRPLPAVARALACAPARAADRAPRRRSPLGQTRRCQLWPRLRRQQDAQARVPRRRRARARLRHARLDRRRAVESHETGRRCRRPRRARVRPHPGVVGRVARRHLRPRGEHPPLPA